MKIILNDVEYRFDGKKYWVSKNGNMLVGNRIHVLRVYSPWVDHQGYLHAGRRQRVHRLVAELWLPKPENGKQHVHHINEIRADNRADNLQWVSKAEHVRDIHKTAGHPVSEEHRARLRELHLGSKLSEETRRKIGETAKRLGLKPPSWAGKKHSDETKGKMSYGNNMNRRCRIHGVEYRSFAEAGRALGERPLSLRKRCLSHNFPGYELV